MFICVTFITRDWETMNKYVWHCSLGGFSVGENGGVKITSNKIQWKLYFMKSFNYELVNKRKATA